MATARLGGLAITNITDENNKEFTPAIKKAHKAHNVKLVAMSNARLIALEQLRRRPPPRLILDRPTFATTKVDVCYFSALEFDRPVRTDYGLQAVRKAIYVQGSFWIQNRTSSRAVM